jgi:hypothetical protein
LNKINLNSIVLKKKNLKKYFHPDSNNSYSKSMPNSKFNLKNPFHLNIFTIFVKVKKKDFPTLIHFCLFEKYLHSKPRELYSAFKLKSEKINSISSIINSLSLPNSPSLPSSESPKTSNFLTNYKTSLFTDLSSLKPTITATNPNFDFN